MKSFVVKGYLENHYPAFGLTMSGISSKAAGKLENRYKFNDGTELENKEFSDGSGLELYSTDFRSYDAQIGRFHQIDPLADFAEYNSPYVFASNNPISFNDPTGLIDSATHETSTVDKPKDLEPVVVIAPRKFKPKMDNTQVVINTPVSLKKLAPTPVSDNGGYIMFGSGSGVGSTATPSTRPDPNPFRIGLLLDAISMYSNAGPLENPYDQLSNYTFALVSNHLELQEMQKKAKEEKKKESSKSKSVTKTVLDSVWLKVDARVYDRYLKATFKVLPDGTAQLNFEKATDTFPARK